MKLHVAAAIFVLIPLLAYGAETCPAGIGGDEGATPARTFRLKGSAGILICGWSDKDARGRQIYSEFEIIDAKTRQVLLRFGAMDEVTIAERRARIEFTEYRRYPLDKGWTTKSMAFRRHVLTGDGGAGIVMRAEIIFVPPRFTKAQLDDICQIYDRSKQTGRVRDGLPTLMMLAALSGNEGFASLLPSLVDELHLDGALGEEYADAMIDFEALKGRKK